MAWRSRRGQRRWWSARLDLEIGFCERCGRDRDALPVARAAFRSCSSCGSACCPDCWNLLDEACLACAPFRLRAETSRSKVIPLAPGPAADSGPPSRSAGADRYAELRDSAEAPVAGGPTDSLGGWEATRATARQRSREEPAAGAPPVRPADAWRSVVAAAEPPAPKPVRRRRGRVALAAGGGWLIVAVLAVAALGASPGSLALAPPPTAHPTPPLQAGPTASPAPAATRKPTPKPQRPRTTPRPARPAATARPPAPTARPTRKPTPRPVKPVVVTPPPAPTPAPTVAPTPPPTPAPTAESTSPG